jgi:uncharacterized protein (TIGR02284 family)
MYRAMIPLISLEQGRTLSGFCQSVGVQARSFSLGMAVYLLLFKNTEGRTMKDMNGRMKLNELIQICDDACRGFRQAAGEVDNKAYREFFRAKALERGDFVHNLRNAALKLGVVPTREGTILGSFHRAWMNFRHHLNPHHDEIPLLECCRGEEHALKVYEDVMENHSLPQVEPTLEQQFVAMIETRDVLRSSITGASEETISGSVLHLL